MRKIIILLGFVFFQNFIFSLSPKSSFVSQQSFLEYLQKKAAYFEGNQYSCFDFSELPVVLKILKTKGSFSENEFIKPLHLIIERIPLEKLMNGEIFPKTIAVKINEKGLISSNLDSLPDTLLQERVLPVNKFLINEFIAIKMSAGDEQVRHIRIIKTVLAGFKKTLEDMASYGIVDTDPVQAFPNYGVTGDGRVVCFDFSHLKPIEEASAFHVTRLLRKSLNEFDTYAGSPGSKVPLEIYRELSDFILLEAKFYESSALDRRVNATADVLKSYYQIIQSDQVLFQINRMYENSLLLDKAA